MSYTTRIIDATIENLPLPWLPLPTTQSALCDVAHTLQDDNNLHFDQEWEDLRYLPWRFFYLDYLHLQQTIKQHSDTATLEDEWKKVHDFYMLKRGEIERRIESCHLNQDKSKSNKSTYHNIAMDIHYLYHFAKLNYCGFLMLFMQFHPLFGPPNNVTLRKIISDNTSIYHQCATLFQFAVRINSLYLESNLILAKTDHFYDTSASIYQVETCTTKTTPLFRSSHVAPQQEEININIPVENCNNNNDQKVALIASRHTLSPAVSFDSCETALYDEGDGFRLHDTQPSRTVKKYWIHPDNVLELFLYLSSKMVAQDRLANPSSYSASAVDQVGYPYTQKSDEKTSLQQYINKVTTVYLDTPQFDSYADLLSNDKRASPVSITRIRWYDEGNDSSVGLEKKAYDRTENKQCGLVQQWVQQRVWLKSKHLQPWLDGNYSIGYPFSKDSCQYRTDGVVTWKKSDKQRMLATCLAIEKQVHSKQKIAVLKVTQNRISFVSVDGSAYISIDTDIAMMQQLQTQDDYPYIGSQDIVRFPYCVVQISTDNCNQWIENLIQCAMLEPVDNFSTYLHGVGTLFRDQVEAVPNWISNTNDIRHVEARGQWLIGKPTKKEKTLLNNKNNDNMTKDVLYCSTTTIATIVTCHDDEIADDEETTSPWSASSSNYCSQKMQPSSSSASLSPIPERGLRRSFDSYCSFDHPTSSRSDPHNCKSCMGHMFIMKDTEEEEEERKMILPTSASSTSIYQPDNPVTFGSFLFQTFLPRRFRSLEKEPLLGGKKNKRKQSQFEYSSTASSSSTTLYEHVKDEELGQKKVHFNQDPSEYSRATILTFTCVIMSLSMSYLFYIIMLEKL